ncbi:MAG: hypothetical protein WCC22_11855 [Terriglobales bacterium]
MKFSRTIRLLLLLLGINLWAAAQDDSASPQQPAPTPAPAFGQNAPILNPENPPISGLDQPSLELRTATRSFFSPGLMVSESADTNPSNQLGTSGFNNVKSVTHVLGALDLQRFWPKSDLLAEYLGGGAFYNSGPDPVRQMQALAAMGVTRWRTGQLTLRDSFSYLPEGSFSLGTYGGAPGLGLARGGLGTGIPGGGLPGTHFFGNGDFGAIGFQPRTGNTAIADAVETLTPRSAITVASGFALSHFQNGNANLINSEQWTFEGGFSHLLGRRDQVALVYAFQDFLFPFTAGGDIHTNVANLRYGHTISGRMSLLVGAGPQYISIYEPGNPSQVDRRWSLSAQARLSYKFPRTTLSLAYEKYTSPGSGFFAGADTQVGRASFMRPLGRTFEFYGDLGYSYHKRLQQLLFSGTAGQRYSDGFIGGILRKNMSRNFGVFAAYHFSELAFDRAFCTASSPCSRISNVNIATIGVDWHPRPVRIE